MSKCSIIIPVWNQLKFTKNCLESIFANTIYKDYQIIAVDNASGHETREYLKGEALKRNNFILIRNNENQGFIKAVNKGIERAVADKSPYICILNNDTLVFKNWLYSMISVLENNKSIGIVNPSSNTLGQKRHCFERNKIISDYTEMPSCTGFCMLFRARLIEKIGYFDEIFGMGNFEDMDFSTRAKNAGYILARADKAYVYHEEGISFRFFKRKNEEFNKNREIFESRYGKKKRILFFLGKEPQSRTTFEDDVKKHALNGHWVWIISTFKNRGKILSKAYPQVKLTYISGLFAALYAYIKILFKKKPFTDIYIYGNTRLYIFLKKTNIKNKNICLTNL